MKYISYAMMLIMIITAALFAYVFGNVCVDVYRYGSEVLNGASLNELVNNDSWIKLEIYLSFILGVFFIMSLTAYTIIRFRNTK